MTNSTTRSVTIGHIYLRSTVMRPNNNNNNDNVSGAVIMSTSHNVAVIINNCLQHLVPQSVMPSLDHCNLQRHVDVKNLPKVVTLQRRGQELKLQPWCCKSNALTTTSEPPNMVV